MKKTVKTVEYAAIEFTDEEIEELGLKKDYPYSITEEDGKIILTPYATIEIELEDYTKEQLMHLIQLAAEKNLTIHELVEEILQEYIDKDERNKI